MILATGGAGQVARALEARAGSRPITRVGRPEFDFDAPETITRTLQTIRPSIVINAAAWTAVDAAEANAEAAMRANRDGPALIARYCAEAGIPLIHISTDYVFDGNKGAPYLETDAPNPIGVYGATKRAGEEAVLDTCPRALVVRTSWVYAEEGKNFILTMLNASKKFDRLRVVGDQRGCPTAASALADALLAMSDRIRMEGRVSGHLSRLRIRRDNLARPRHGPLRGGCAPWLVAADGRCDHHSRLADTGPAAARLAARLW